ncbi:ABC transporter permease [Halococcus dombrowskii]|uniref:ABC transporter permease n=1 Tax=Halococcus dombrowskii TaxID=179637 RepID=A0AAV3SIS1_HALDO|nr:ABC transporter permease [Halococcus dombrowskii]UOO95979.1 ABC transporter permease [Halococcus dombrowskii]
MSRRWQITRRAVFAVLAAFLVVSLVFAFVAATSDPYTGQLARSAAEESAEEDIPVKQTDAWERLVEYRQQRNLDEPVGERYVDWLGDVATLDLGTAFGTTRTGTMFGQSYSEGTPVTSLVASAVSRTLSYLVPAIVFSVVVGISIGVYTATRQHTLVDRLGTSVAHLGFSLPNFWLAEVVVLSGIGVGGLLSGAPGRTNEFLYTVVFPAAVLGTSLLAGQLRYARAQSLEYIDAEFIKLVRAKGAGSRRVARHLLRNAAVPLLSLFFADMLGIVVLNVFVIEYVFGIQGLGGLSLVAIQSRDMPVILGTTLVIVLVGVLGNFVQDVVSLVVDPRVAE